MSKKKATGRGKATRSKARSATKSNAIPLAAAQRLAINTAIDRRIRHGELILQETKLVGRKSVALLMATMPRVKPILRQQVRDLERIRSRLPDDAMQAAILRHTLDAFIFGFRLAAAASMQSKRTAAGAGASATSARAEAKRRLIVAAYDETDSSLPEAERYAAVKRAAGVKSITTIRNALRKR